MKRLLTLLLAFIMLVSLCSCKSEGLDAAPQKENDTEYKAITEIDHCVVEPDDRLHMTDLDREYYKSLMNAMLSRENKVRLCENTEQNEYYIDLLKQSPYYYFLSECTLKNDTVYLSYAYTEKQQNKMLDFIDNRFLEIINETAREDDNTLDKILKVHGAVARAMTYDHQRKDNKQLDSPLFKYPADEIYKALKDEKSVCYGFAYTLRFALLQLDIDCFCVYGPCSGRGEGHMWNIFKYNGKFYTCDCAWDRADEGYAHLFHFGKTDKEREADTLTRIDFSSTFFEEYGEIQCTDEAFKIFRGVSRYAYVNSHTYYIEDFEENEYTLDTETLTMK